MQEAFEANPDLVRKFKLSLSKPRFQKYLIMAKNEDIKAIKLYQWNAKLSESVYIYLQSWEVCLRNKLNDFLCSKYGISWPYDQDKAVRQLRKKNERRRLSKLIERMEKDNSGRRVATASIVTNLSLGFWVALLSKHYDIPYAWDKNLSRVFPNDHTLDLRAAWEICDGLLNFRNRVAHHEPILHLPLEQRHRDLQRIVGAMCEATYIYAEASCTFRNIWNSRP